MLKLTNSFYRYITVSSERVDYKAHVKNYSHLSRIREIRKANCVDFKLKRQINCYMLSQKQSNSRKRPKIKTRSMETRSMEAEARNKQMSKSAAVSSNTSYGGTFVVSSDDSSDEEFFRTKTTRSGQGSRTRIPPNFRSWDNIKYSGDRTDSFKFKVVSYNVLAQNLLESHSYLYTECYPRDLKWKVRSARLYDEIVTLAPDILCLQEVQAGHLTNFYAKFEKLGYKGVFKQKTGGRQDGCAIYFRKSVFELKDQISVEFNQPKLPLLNRDNIGVVVKLAPRRAPKNPIVVATTHLLFNPKRADVRLAQMQIFLAEIDRFSFFSKGTESGHLPIILTGDFNSTPDSEVVHLLNEGYVSAKEIRGESDWERIGVTDNCQHLSVYLNRRAGQDTEFRKLQIYNSEYSDNRPEPVAITERRPPGPYNPLFNSGELWQTLRLISVYNKQEDSDEVTTFQDRWVTVDYMYFSSCTTLRLSDRLRLPTAEACKVLKSLPNEVFASDHLALAAVFEIILPKPKYSMKKTPLVK